MRNWLGKRPQLRCWPFADVDQLHRDLVLAGLDQPAEIAKTLTAGKEKHRPFAKAPQREPAVDVGFRRGPLRSIARLEDVDVGQRLALSDRRPARESCAGASGAWAARAAAARRS